MRYRCPKDPSHTMFTTEAMIRTHVMVNAHGEYCEELDTLDMDYTGAMRCADCDAEAVTVIAEAKLHRLLAALYLIDDATGKLDGRLDGAIELEEVKHRLINALNVIDTD